LEHTLNPNTQIVKEKLRIATLLAVNAGFIDAYTFFHYENRFAGAQTGNLIQAGIALAQGKWTHFIGFLIPILFFMAGVMLRTFVSHIRRKYHRGDTTYLLWMQLFMILVFVTIYVIFQHLSATLCISIMSFIMAIQMNNFSVTRGLSYGSIFSTANMRSFAENMAQYFLTGKKEKIENAWVYFALIGSFFIGAALSTILQHFIAIWTLYLSALFLLIVLYIFSRELKNMEKEVELLKAH
jgi:uncharacterized membrane protein YoaK (UPF0700 family)